MKDTIVVVGWGRMGVTHTSIISGLCPGRFDFEVVEPNWKIRRLTKNTLGYRVYRDISDVDLEGKWVIITTPPFTHQRLCSHAVQKGARSIFVEKPFGLCDKRVIDSPLITVGYVLRFTEVAQKLKSIIDEEGCTSIRLSYVSHTLTKRPKGWRNGVYGGVLNEMGSHLIDLLFYLLGNQDLEIFESRCESRISDVDDIVFVRGALGESSVELNLNWVETSCRKPIWSGRLITRNRTIDFDQQSIEGGFDASQVGYYVRGRDFSNQMQHFIDGEKQVRCNSIQANKVHDSIIKIKALE